MKKELFPLFFLAAVLIMITGIAAPATAQVYIGAGIGQSEMDATGVYGDFDDTDMAMKAFVGFQVVPKFAIEAGYADLGTFTMHPDETDPTFTYKWESTTIYLAGIGTVPLSDGISLLVKIGISRWDTDLKISDPTQSISGGDSDINTMFGLGFQFGLAEALMLRVEYEQYQDVGDGITMVPPLPFLPVQFDGSDIDVFGVSLAFHF